jgi:hypothetical protein
MVILEALRAEVEDGESEDGESEDGESEDGESEDRGQDNCEARRVADP